MAVSEDSRPILLFDGICNFCNRWVNFVIRHDKKKQFRFAALQSEAGKKLLKAYAISPSAESVVLIDNRKAYLQSSAALRIMKYMGGIHYLAYFLTVIPPFIRNFFYNLISRNRYKWWGKRDACMIPDKDVQERFL